MNRIACGAAALFLVLPLAGCFTVKHQVGSGAQVGVESGARQWYLLWGLATIGGGADSQELASGAANYDVESEWAPVDILLNIFTGWLTVYSRTVTVTR